MYDSMYEQQRLEHEQQQRLMYINHLVQIQTELILMLQTYLHQP